ncbi:hypothetical protein E4T42_06166 [Aureobasidium subglaciale]|nr:hypothetical protein E4T42_06166 [Aureobasidium subglaciale]
MNMRTDNTRPVPEDQAGNDNVDVHQLADVYKLKNEDNGFISEYQRPLSPGSGSESSGWEVCESPEDLVSAECDPDIDDHDSEQFQETTMPTVGSLEDLSLNTTPNLVEMTEQSVFKSIEKTEIAAAVKIRQLQEMLKVVSSERDDAKQRLSSNETFVTDQYLQIKELHKRVAVSESDRDILRHLFEAADRKASHLDKIIYSDRMQAEYERQDAASKLAYMELQLSGAVETIGKERIEARLDRETLVAAARSNYDQERATTQEYTRVGEKQVKMEAEKNNLVAQICKLECRLEATTAREQEPTPCSDCPHFISENHKSREREQSLQTKLQQSITELGKFRGCTTGLVRGIQDHKACIARLNNQIAALKAEARSRSEKDEQERRLEYIKQMSAPKHKDLVQPLIMRIAVWIGGIGGIETEGALVKMNPDTPYKVVLASLRLHHPHKVLKQRTTGRLIFDSDTPAYLGVEDGEEFDFIQENGEPMFMFDTTITGSQAWRGKNGMV